MYEFIRNSIPNYHISNDIPLFESENSRITCKIYQTSSHNYRIEFNKKIVLRIKKYHI